MYVHQTNPVSYYREIISENKRSFHKNHLLPQFEKEKLKQICVDDILNKVDEFIQNDDLEGALEYIESYKDTLNKHLDINDLKLKVPLLIEYHKILKMIDFHLAHEEFDKAIKLLEKNKELVIQVGKDPEVIKNQILDYKKFYLTIQDVSDLIDKNNIGEAEKLLRSIYEVIKRLEISDETLKEIFPKLNIENIKIKK